jgi:undecaprenyl-diphosphatase
MAVVEDLDQGAVQVFDPPPTRRPFSPGDVLRLLIGLAMVLVGSVVAEVAQGTVEGIEGDLLSAFSRLPDTFESIVLSVAQLGTSLIPITAIVVLLVRKRWKVALLILLASTLANLAMAGVDVFVSHDTLAEVTERLEADDSVVRSTYPNSYVLAGTTGIVTVAAPFLSRRWKRTLWWGVGLLVVLRLMAVAYPASDIVLSVGVGVTVGSLILLVFGSPSNEPGPGELLAGLRGVGLRPRRIDRPEQSGTKIHYDVTDGDGVGYDVDLRTPDEADADLLARTYRGLRFRASEVGTGFASLKRRIEHEALVLTLAEKHGVRAPAVVRIGTTARGSAFLVTRVPPTRPLTTDDLRSPAVLASVWAAVGELHQAGIAHRGLTLEALSIDDDGNVWLDDFDHAETAPPEQETARDVAVLLTETALVIGPDDAVSAAVAALGPDQVAPAMRMLQPLALPPSTRARAKAVDGLLDELRDDVGEATGEPELELEDLERIKPRTLLVIGASTLAFYSLLPQLANLSDTVDAFGNAQPLWILAAVAASALTYVFAAVSFEGAVPAPVPFAPNLRAQVASSFAGLVGPGGAGGFALTGRFLQRIGLSGPEAAASVAVNAVGGFAIHAALLVTFVVWSGQSDIGGFSLPDSTTVLLVLALLLAVAGVLVAIGPVRERVFVPAWAGIRTGLAHIGQVFTQPSRVAELFGGSLALSLTYVVAMACTVEAFGGGLTFVQIGAAYLFAVAIATLAPTPGGLGALEAALIAGLTGFGLGSGIAVSAVLTFRLATFWLPILPGWLAVGWMQRNDEV